MNPDLKSLVEDEDFSQAAPYLFGPGFGRKAKERSEAVECSRKASSTLRSKSFFEAADIRLDIHRIFPHIKAMLMFSICGRPI